MKKLIRDRRGFTAAELLVAMGLGAVAAVIIYSVFFSTRNAYFDTRGVSEAQSDSRSVLSLMSQDLRSAGSDPRRIGLQRLPIADLDDVRVQNDADGDGVIDAAGEPAEDVTWSFDAAAGTVIRTTPQGANVLLNNVTGLQFTYLDAAGNALGPLPLSAENRDLVRAVDVSLTVELLDDNTRTWNTLLALRNDP
ncbi:MAG: prepilin-type N-terminal cleavage/methylation domain-containing protein [Gemmatimonadetes bacterium]|nr:prepilin-type N-terminal cleavage/methylation domain-containing protein [Gemmatimonadota bacterium]